MPYAIVFALLASSLPVASPARTTASPWTITHRPFENNVHKVTYAALPLLALLRFADPGLFGVALGVAFLFGSLMSNVSVG